MGHVPQELSSGSWFQNTGTGGKSGYWLLPEEVLFMVSSGRMDLLNEQGLDLGLLGTWGTCIESAGGVNVFLVRNLDRAMLTGDLLSTSESRISRFQTRAFKCSPKADFTNKHIYINIKHISKFNPQSGKHNSSQYNDSAIPLYLSHHLFPCDSTAHPTAKRPLHPAL
jgi:tRNA-splicing endonuclease subunit sen54 N-term